MRRLDFVLADFTRTIWATGAARRAWEPRIQAFGQAWSQLEKLSVVTEMRPSCLITATPQELLEISLYAASKGLVALPMSREGAMGTYSATPQPVTSESDWRYRVVLTRPALAADWYDAWSAGNNDKIGRLLGFPDCCREFFQRTWVDEKMVDTSWAMGGAMGTEEELSKVSGSPEGNILLRWLGVRLVPHLPCSFDCEHSAEFGRRFVELGRENGFSDEMDTALEMLSWPVEWSALHGIAEVKTPILKIVTRTDATAGKLVVQREGTTYPAEGVTGLGFPYKPNPKLQLSKLRSFKKSVEDRGLWTENGFSSLEAMTSSHDALIAALPEIPKGGRILDLGCGNGALLSRIAGARKDLELHGVELEQDRVLSAAGRFVEAIVYWGDIFDLNGGWRTSHFDVVIFMPGRLEEVSPKKAGELVDWLRTNADSVLLYAYGDWTQQYGYIAGKHFGLIPTKKPTGDTVAELWSGALVTA